jgi:hypothetical protein
MSEHADGDNSDFDAAGMKQRYGQISSMASMAARML